MSREPIDALHSQYGCLFFCVFVYRDKHRSIDEWHIPQHLWPKLVCIHKWKENIFKMAQNTNKL